MSNFTDFIGGGGGSASFPTIFLHNSQTWVPPQDGNIMIHVIGAGGSGTGSISLNDVQSGAAGGYCRKNSLAVTTSGSFTVTIGAGGVSRIGSSGAGTAGGVTSMAGTGLSLLRGFGGAGGALSTGSFTTGGAATGGDVNYTGGRGGFRIGGGAVGLTGTGNDGFFGANEFRTVGANCDILGDFYSSTLGQISGGAGGVVYTANNVGCLVEAGELAGGGSSAASSIPLAVGHASIGGGGGWTQNSTVADIISGRGGEGCVVIQYIL